MQSHGNISWNSINLWKCSYAISNDRCIICIALGFRPDIQTSAASLEPMARQLRQLRQLQLINAAELVQCALLPSLCCTLGWSSWSSRHEKTREDTRRHEKTWGLRNSIADSSERCSILCLIWTAHFPSRRYWLYLVINDLMVIGSGVELFPNHWRLVFQVLMFRFCAFKAFLAFFLPLPSYLNTFQRRSWNLDKMSPDSQVQHLLITSA